MTKEYNYGKALDTRTLMKYLCVGVSTAEQIGRDAGAVIYVGKKRIYNRSMIDAYIDKVTGSHIDLEKSVKDLQRELDM